MQRIGLLLHVRPEKLDEYKQIHANIWPDLKAALTEAGIRNYSLWLCPDGTEFGYLECDDWDATCAMLDKAEVHTRWQKYMEDYLIVPESAGPGGQPVTLLEQSFLLE